MNRIRAIFGVLVLTLSGCATGRYWDTRVEGLQPSSAFISALDTFLRSEGLMPYEELHPNESPANLAALTNGGKRWEKDFKFTWPEQAGFIAVRLGSVNGIMDLSVGNSSNRIVESGVLAGALKEWLHANYPNAKVEQNEISFVDLR
jgi:hypothetical protein